MGVVGVVDSAAPLELGSALSPKTAWMATAQAVCVCAVGQALALIVRLFVYVRNVFILLFAPFRAGRRRVQRVVDRRFYRRRYDAVQTLTQLTERLRDRRDPDASGGDLCRVVDGTVQPAHALLWTVPGRTP